jgi:uncharacterized protein (DUF4415 family)
MLKTTERRKTAEEKLDAELKGMKRLPRGSFKAKPGASDARNCKVKITTYLDADVLEYFKRRAEQPNAAPYQTQINNELRKVMENKSQHSEDVKTRLLENDEFLRALKAKLKSIEEPPPKWSKWKAMPRREKCREIEGPAGPGVYQIRNKRTGQLIMFGQGEECQNRMKSLYPKPWGSGTRKNLEKREHILKNWPDLQYRTIATSTIDEAQRIERVLRSEKNHLFNT